MLLINLRFISTIDLGNLMYIRFIVILFILSSTHLQAQDAREKFKFAKFNYDKDNYSEALKYLNQAIEEDDQYVSAFYLRAETNYSLEQYYNAILDINRIFKIDNTANTSSSDYYLTRGKSFLALNDYSNARADLEKSLSYSSVNSQSHYFLAKYYLKTKEYREALAEVERALKINGTEPDFHALKAEIKIAFFKPVIGSEEYKDILNEINTAISLDEFNYDYYNIRSNFFKDLGEIDEAIEDYDAMIRLSPKEDDAYTSRGLIKMSQYQYRGAALDFSKSILLNPEMEKNYRYRGLCYNNLNNFRDAYKDFTKSIEMLSVKLNSTAEAHLVKNELGETYVLRGHCLNLMGNNAQACRDFLQAHNLGVKKGLNYYRKYCGIY